MNTDKRWWGLDSPHIPIRSGGTPAGRINSMELVQHNKHIIHNVAMMDLNPYWHEL